MILGFAFFKSGGFFINKLPLKQNDSILIFYLVLNIQKILRERFINIDASNWL